MKQLADRAVETLLGLNEAYQRTQACLRIWPGDPGLMDDLEKIQDASMDIQMHMALEDPHTQEAIELAEESFCLVK